MKLLTILMVALFSISSFAGVLKKSVPQSVLDKLNIGNGSTYIKTVTPGSFDIEKRLSNIRKWNAESGCSNWVTESSLETTIAKLHQNGAQELAIILENLRISNQLKAGIYNTSLPSNDLFNCTFYYYEIYSNDGEVLVLDLDFNR